MEKKRYPRKTGIKSASLIAILLGLALVCASCGSSHGSSSSGKETAETPAKQQEEAAQETSAEQEAVEQETSPEQEAVEQETSAPETSEQQGDPDSAVLIDEAPDELTAQAQDAGGSPADPSSEVESEGDETPEDDPEIEEDPADGTDLSEKTETAEETSEKLSSDELYYYGLSAAQGLWNTGSSENAPKQICGINFLEFSEREFGDGHPLLTGASWFYSVETIPGQPESAGYALLLNTGNKYYMYADDKDFLECHWDPDGYSASDSLIRQDESEALKNAQTYVMNGADIKTALKGRVSRFTGYYNLSDTEECYALNLEEPICLITEAGGRTMVYAVQVSGDFDALERAAQNGSTVTMSGYLWEGFTMHHYTPVILSAEEIK